jgi:hypothetical protein
MGWVIGGGMPCRGERIKAVRNRRRKILDSAWRPWIRATPRRLSMSIG